MEKQIKPLEEQNLKIRIQILDVEDNVLISSVISQMMVHNLNVYHGVSGVDQAYNLLLDELSKKTVCRKMNWTTTTTFGDYQINYIIR